MGPLPTKRLGRTAVEVTRLGLGGGPLAGRYAPLDDDTTAAALAAAWDGGIRYLDTSPHYGLAVVAGVVAGMRSAAEVRSNVASFQALPAALWSDLSADGLVDERAMRFA